SLSIALESGQQLVFRVTVLLTFVFFIVGKYVLECPKNLVFTFTITSCLPTCRTLTEPDKTCDVHFDPLPGCTCSPGTYIDPSGRCVPASQCPCYYRGFAILSGEVIHDNGITCNCTKGKLYCTSPTRKGCACPPGLVWNDKGDCIEETQCPCIHNGILYEPGEQIRIQCNTCTCSNRRWMCTKKACLATCIVYGDGHYITFDAKTYNFNGDCQYTLVQVAITGQCSNVLISFVALQSLSSHSLRNDELQGTEQVVPFRVRLMGIYLVVEAHIGLIILNKNNKSLFQQGSLCGLCGNYDGNANNDFTTRGNAIVGNVEEFGNSWKLTSLCPDAVLHKYPCSLNPYRLSWAQKQCSIITSSVFSICHPHVDPKNFYDACVSDSCACNTGGDCECFCTAVAAYAQICGEFGICVSWRTPDRCPLFCDYYNDRDECEWHYKPCGAPCMRTCRNPSGKCSYEIRGLEGCYPSCPDDRPLFDEDEMKCVSKCGCYDDDRMHYRVGERVPSRRNCYVW
uniref:VWFD domain-containing protein n=1 Tax=Leptobrachium leishanense TaxID=445787 RepID=A0A8C5R8G6_9ANUR